MIHRHVLTARPLIASHALLLHTNFNVQFGCQTIKFLRFVSVDPPFGPSIPRNKHRRVWEPNYSVCYYIDFAVVHVATVLLKHAVSVTEYMDDPLEIGSVYSTHKQPF